MTNEYSGNMNRFPVATLIEVSWEVCNQLGGIYTVIRSKVPAVMRHKSGPYFMVGPYVSQQVMAEVDLLEDFSDAAGLAVKKLREEGVEAYYAEWLITGRPRVVLLNPASVAGEQLNVIKYLLWKDFGIETPPDNTLINQVVSFAHLVTRFLELYMSLAEKDIPVIGHFHEWMSGLPILYLKRKKSAHAHGIYHACYPAGPPPGDQFATVL